jgi:SUKH superfamily protein
MQTLHSILPRPASPVEIPSEADWKDVAQTIGAVPEDYREFLRAYGTGSIDRFVWIFNPASRNPNLNLFHQVPRQVAAFRELVATGCEAKVYPIFPEPAGLLPFGITDNGDVLLWHRNGMPKDWSVVLSASRSPTYEEFDSSMTGFLTAVLKNEINSRVLPAGFPSSSPVFSPLSL